MTRCPQCGKDYTPDFPERMLSAEPYQNEQHQLGYCSDKCFDEALSGSRPEYTYDEKGRRFENGERKLFADPPEQVRKMEKVIKTLVEFEFVIETPQDEKAKQEIRDAIKDKIINDGNAYYQDDEEASMVSVEIKRYGI